MTKREELQEELINILQREDYIYNRASQVAELEFKISQFKSQEQSVVMPNTEDVINAAHKAFPYDDEGIPDSHTYSFCQGVDWFKSQLKPGYPKEFLEWCIEAVDTEEREEVDYCYAVWSSHNVLGFDTLEELYIFWQTEVNGR